MGGVKSFDERLLYRAGRVASALPVSIQRALSGGPVVREGSELEPELALMIKVGGRSLSPGSMTLERYRAEQAKEAHATPKIHSIGLEAIIRTIPEVKPRPWP